MNPLGSFLRASAALCVLLSFSLDVFAGGVRIVDPAGARNYPDIQSAINAAGNGDILLVGAGSYAGFLLNGKNLAILAAPGGVSITSTMTIRNVAGQCVVAGFSVEPPAYPNCGVGLSVVDCDGYVAFQDCTFAGSVGTGPWGHACLARDGGEIRNCASVVLSRCSFAGGEGMWYGTVGNAGAHGCAVDSSMVAAYGSVFRGGKGGTAITGGAGGDGLRATYSMLFASGSSFLGGDGGDGTIPTSLCGVPGTGLVLTDAPSAAYLLQPTASGGAGGSNCIPSGSAGAYRGPGFFGFLPGTSRGFRTPILSVDREPWALSVTGLAGDQVFLNRSLAPVFSYEPSLSGVCTAWMPPFPLVPPLGSIPASGTLALDVQHPLLPGGTIAELEFLQGYAADSTGAIVLGSPMHVLSLNWDSGPDWNGNGINDYAEVITGTAVDSNHDLIPDFGGVRIVDATGARNFLEIQPAVDAALDGDVLLVGEGSYSGFTIDGKNLSIFVAPSGAPVSITGPVTLRNVSGSCLVVGLSVAPAGYDRALSVVNCAGDVRFQGCTFRGHDGYSSWVPYQLIHGSPAVDIEQSSRVVLAGCGLVAGWSPGVNLGGYPGAHGLGLQGSSVALYDSYSVGGAGPSSMHDDPGEGGAGAELQASWLFASNCAFQGGNGGDDLYQPVPWGGACGGAGIHLDANSSVHVLDVTATAGAEGSPPILCAGVPGIDSQGGLVDLLAGLSRSFELASLSVDRAAWRISLTGVPGDQVFLNRGLVPVFQYEPALYGVCTSRLPPFPNVPPLGTVLLSGSLALDVPQRLLPDNVVAQVSFLQGYTIDAGGVLVLGSPLHVLSVNWNSLPDCNGNGINDYAEVIAGVTPDLDHDLKPDGCP